MNDKDKSKDQLISELAAARRKISRLEGIITAGQMESQIFHWALESAPNAFLMLDKAGDITMVNKIAEQLFGYERGAAAVIFTACAGTRANFRSEFVSMPFRPRPVFAWWPRLSTSLKRSIRPKR
ncbi:MAG: hypothetical protein UV78_C0039G0008 [Parcubacteria group bacterium GW2011_GWA2_43_17]|nr:MAG: hypothetical protein UV78_C0039G0008 [Parcubacteria group bacterium GW2011_GWA2_43_17]